MATDPCYRGAMAQVKIYGLKSHLSDKRSVLSNAIHACVMEVLGLPETKRAHRFFQLAEEDFFMPEGRSTAYTILEIVLMSGRAKETKKRLVRRLYEELEAKAKLSPVDLEICLIESPPENWGFRGVHGDEAELPYAVRR